MIANAEGSSTTSSVVAFTEAGERLVGQLGRRRSALNPKGTHGLSATSADASFGDGPAGGQRPGGDDVIDAEFTA